MQCFFLVCSAFVYFMYSFLVFSERLNKDSSYFFVCSMFVGFLYSLLWYYSSRAIADKNEYFMFVLLRDFVYMSVFYFTPTIVYGINLNKWGLLGLIMMVGGLLVMKLGRG